MKHFINLMRVQQYIKNLFIFMPLFFAGQFTNIKLLLNAFIAFVAFSFVASAVYILNDLYDIEVDKKHPSKRYRPLASGSISKKNAFFFMCFLFIIGILLMATLPLKTLFVLFAYIILNFGYNFYFKNIAILDVAIISIGFVLRIFVGSTATNISPSMWIVIMTFLLALFLSLAKRRDDVLLFLDTGKKMREAINDYNLQIIDNAMSIMSAVVIVSYILYATSTEVVQRMHSEYLYCTALFVILGIMRYLQIIFVEKNSSSPTRVVFKDKFLQITILVWFCSFVWIIYL